MYTLRLRWIINGDTPRCLYMLSRLNYIPPECNVDHFTLNNLSAICKGLKCEYDVTSRFCLRL